MNENTDTWGETYDAPAVTEQSLDTGGNYVSPAESLDGGFEPMGTSDED